MIVFHCFLLTLERTESYKYSNPVPISVCIFQIPNNYRAINANVLNNQCVLNNQ